MTHHPLITVVLPVFNRAEIVTRTLRSIAIQDLRPLRIILVDNGSTDSTMKVLSRWKSENETSDFIIDLFSEQGRGASVARNRGLREVISKYVMFFDSDDEMLPGHLSRIAAYLESQPQTDLLRWDVGIIDEDCWMQVKSPQFHDEWQLNLLHGSMSTLRYIVRTSLICQVGGWDETLSVWDDIELASRLLFQSITLRKLNGEPLVVIHPTVESITGKDYTSRIESHTLALNKIESNIPADNPNAESYRRAVKVKRAILSGLYAREGSRTESVSMFSTALNGLDWRSRVAMRLVQMTVRLFGHGGVALGLFFFGVKKPRD